MFKIRKLNGGDRLSYDGIVYTRIPHIPSPPQHFLLGSLRSTPSLPTTSAPAPAAASSSPPSPPKRSIPPVTSPSTTAAMPSSQTLVETLSGRSPPTENDNTTHRNDIAKKPKLPHDMHTIFEAEIREEFSHHHRGVTRINNDSFGNCPRSVLTAQSTWQLRFLQQPNDFYFNALRPGILVSRAAIQDLINADHVGDVSIVDNATTAVIVLQQRMHCVRLRPKEREARRREMVLEKDGWLETKGRSSKERDGVGEGGVYYSSKNHFVHPSTQEISTQTQALPHLLAACESYYSHARAERWLVSLEIDSDNLVSWGGEVYGLPINHLPVDVDDVHLWGMDP
ncbi:hypothetical protein JHK82_049443 [Glycine max]|nr:hypothetical protein JHK85_050066 [Glycine max]KAG5090665.1 hypothetical protein JHK82_049443 [Glycine max]